MININISKLMQNELLYSFIVRTAYENEMTASEFACNFILEDCISPETRRNIAIPFGSTVYVPELAKALGKSPLELYIGTTVYPGTSPLMSRGKQCRMINFSFRKKAGLYPNLIGHPQTDASTLKYCPVCRDEDIREHGFAWLRREHHMPGVQACYRHGVKLVSMDMDPRYQGYELYLPQTNPEPADRLHISYAGFAHDFLDARFDFDSTICRKMMLNTQKSCLSDAEFSILLGTDRKSYFRSLRKCRRQFDEWKLLAGLFAVFGYVEEIPQHSDERLQEHFMSCLDGYKVLSDYSGTIVEMCKEDSAEPFITTPWGFTTGWRDPSDDPDDEAEKLRSIISLTCCEFEPLDPPSENMRFMHTSCGKTIIASARKVAEHGLTCPCQDKTFLNEEFARKKVEEAGNYELISVNNKVLTICSLDCGHIFDVDSALWTRKPGCRVCFEERHNDTIFKYRNSVDDGSYNPAEAFKREVALAAGDAYVVTGEYVNATEPISILHKTCGHTKSYLPVAFLHGARCGCEKFQPRGNEFIVYVRLRSCGRYEICGTNSAKQYLIRNTITGEVKAMTRCYIIQELERPLSLVLPLEKKGQMLDPAQMYLDIAMDYLSNNTEADGIFDRKALHIPGMSKRKLISVISTLKKQGIIGKIGGVNSLYRFYGKNGNGA